MPWSSSRRDVFGVVGGFLLSGSYFKFIIKMLGPESSNVNKDMDLDCDMHMHMNTHTWNGRYINRGLVEWQVHRQGHQAWARILGMDMSTVCGHGQDMGAGMDR